MEYHLGDSIAIGSGGLEFEDKENPQVELYADRMSRVSGTENNDLIWSYWMRLEISVVVWP